MCVCVWKMAVSTYWLAGRRISIRLGPNDGQSVGSTRPTHVPSPRIGSLGRPRAPLLDSEIVKKEKEETKLNWEGTTINAPQQQNNARNLTI